MNKKLIQFLLLSLATGFSAQLNAANKAKRFAIFDSDRTEKYCYQPVIDIIRSHNFDVSYYGLDTIIDTPVNQVPFHKYDCMFFIISTQLIQSLDKDISYKFLDYLSRAAQDPNKMIGLLFPESGLAPHDPEGSLSPLFKRVGFNIQNIMLKKLTNRFLRLPFRHRLIPYHTTLKNPSSGGALFNVRQELKGRRASLALLPMHQNHHDRLVQNLFPLGIYWHNPKKRSHLVISNSSLFSFAGIMENFSFCPMRNEIRQKILMAVSEMFGDIAEILSDSEQKNLPIKNLPIKPHPSIKGKQTITAWMELKTKPADQKRLIDHIFTSKLDYLWITLNPQEYHSPIAKKANQTETFYKNISAFTKMLSEGAKKRKVRPPSILIGFEIVNNLYPPNLPSETAEDMYGKRYEDIPRPLDTAFWRNEVTHPLQTLLSRWKEKTVSNGINIAGIMIDLEMYLRKQSASFLPTMGFSPETAKLFLNKKNLYKEIPTNLFPQLLVEKKWGKEYFSYLENQSENLAKQIKATVQGLLPNGLLFCYAPNMSVDWFYKGFYRGLSSPDKPIHLFTFNSEFMAHDKWLRKNKIFAKHSSVLMLSKMKNANDFHLSDEILKNHHGVWVNKFSRLTERPHGGWSILEQTPMNPEGRLAFLRHLGNLGRKSK